jgi:hypothetical protein
LKDTALLANISWGVSIGTTIMVGLPELERRIRNYEPDTPLLEDYRPE